MFEHAQAREDAGAALARAGRQLDAGTLSDRALEVYAEIGVRRDGARALAIARRLFISRRTVQKPVSHAFGKLEITSRVELAA